MLAAGIDVRLKRAVGLHFMGRKVDVNAFRDFMFDIIITFEEKTACYMDAIICDLGPHNIALLKTLGVAVAQGKNEYFIVHPADSNRKLYILPDPVHTAKCIAAAVRRGDMTIPQEFVAKFNLKTNKAKISEVESLFKRQQSMCFKPGSGLTRNVLNPDHYETMDPKIAQQLMSADVTTSISFMYEERGETKKSAMVFLLEQFDRWTKIMTSSTYFSNNISSFEEDVVFLEEFVRLVDNLKFKNRIRHQSGAVMSTRSMIELVRGYLEKGVIEVKTSRFNQNALENIFSQTDSFALKPSAVHFMDSLRAVTICQAMIKPVRGSAYTWEEYEERGTCFLELVTTMTKASDFEDLCLLEDFHVPDVMSADIFSDILEYKSFLAEMHNLVGEIIEKIYCEECKEQLLRDSTSDHTGIQLKRMKENSQTMISSAAENFFLKAEFVFRQLTSNENSSVDKNNFMFIANSQLLLFHCEETAQKAFESFFKLRVKKICRREVHRANNFASKSLSR